MNCKLLLESSHFRRVRAQKGEVHQNGPALDFKSGTQAVAKELRPQAESMWLMEANPRNFLDHQEVPGNDGLQRHWSQFVSLCFTLGMVCTPPFSEMRCKMSTVLSTPCSSGMAYLARETARNKEKKKETKLSKEEKHTKVQNLVTYHPLAITIDPTCLMT